MPRIKPRYTEKVYTHLTPEQLDALQAIVAATGIGLAALVRAAVVERHGLPPAPLNATEASRVAER